MTRLDRIERALNSNLPGEPQDTSSAGAMLAGMRQVGALVAAALG
jgi:hypothetical protein